MKHLKTFFYYQGVKHDVFELNVLGLRLLARTLSFGSLSDSRNENPEVLKKVLKMKVPKLEEGGVQSFFSEIRHLQYNHGVGGCHFGALVKSHFDALVLALWTSPSALSTIKLLYLSGLNMMVAIMKKEQ